MTQCQEKEQVTNEQCNQQVEDHRISMSRWGLMLLHTIDNDAEGMFNWYSGPGFDRYMSRAV